MREPVGINREMFWLQFQCNVALELRVICAKHNTIPPSHSGTLVQQVSQNAYKYVSPGSSGCPVTHANTCMAPATGFGRYQTTTAICTIRGKGRPAPASSSNQAQSGREPTSSSSFSRRYGNCSTWIRFPCTELVKDVRRFPVRSKLCSLNRPVNSFPSLLSVTEPTVLTV